MILMLEIDYALKEVLGHAGNKISVSKLHGTIHCHNENSIELQSISKSIMCFGSIYFEEFHAIKGH